MRVSVVIELGCQGALAQPYAKQDGQNRLISDGDAPVFDYLPYLLWFHVLLRPTRLLQEHVLVVDHLLPREVCPVLPVEAPDDCEDGILGVPVGPPRFEVLLYQVDMAAPRVLVLRTLVVLQGLCDGAEVPLLFQPLLTWEEPVGSGPLDFSLSSLESVF